LSGIRLGGKDLTGVNLAGQNLMHANFVAGPVCSPFFGCFGPYYAKLTDADLTAADARGANGLGASNLSGATTANLIWPDGHIDGLNLEAEGLLVVRDYGDPSYFPELVIPITIDQHLAMGARGTLRMVFEADAWNSTISFAPGIPVTLGGTLELTFAADVNLASQVGRTFDLFDWTGVNPIGTFSISSPYRWDLSNLYSTGDVTLSALPEPTTFALVIVVFVVRFRSRPRNS
jgi:uncharacterized protein YjbI with pentapeptide repeats